VLDGGFSKMQSAAVIGRSLDRRAAPPVFRYDATPGLPRVRITRLRRSSMDGIQSEHAHDFLVLAYFERGGATLRIGQNQWAITAGDAYVVAPGEVVGIGTDRGRPVSAAGWAVAFPPDGVAPDAPEALLSWRAHPLLLPFARGGAAGAQRLHVPSDHRPWWRAEFSAIEQELQQRRDGFSEAVRAHLTLLLIAVARLAADVVSDLKVKQEPLLASVFGFIESHYTTGISLKDVAAAVSLTPGHLTTQVKLKTGRTVQDWIKERQMAEARRMLVGTDHTIAEVGRSLGYGDAAYFARRFRQTHGTTPLAWRRAARA
jgi:AraC family transcriptional regulator, transcriptional activator of pobA